MGIKFHEYFYKLPIPEKLKDNVFNEERKKIKHIENLSKVNIFVG